MPESCSFGSVHFSSLPSDTQNRKLEEYDTNVLYKNVNESCWNFCIHKRPSYNGDNRRNVYLVQVEVVSLLDRRDVIWKCKILMQSMW